MHNRKEMFLPIPENISPKESAETSIRYLANHFTGGFRGSPKTRQTLWTHFRNLGSCVLELREEGKHLELLDVCEEEIRNSEVNGKMPKCKKRILNSVVQLITSKDIEGLLKQLSRSLNP